VTAGYPCLAVGARSPAEDRKPVWRQLGNSANEVYLLPISIWEAHLPVRRNSLTVKPTFRQWLDQVLERIPVKESPFDFVVGVETGRIELPQSDPGDV